MNAGSPRAQRAVMGDVLPITLPRAVSGPIVGEATWDVRTRTMSSPRQRVDSGDTWTRSDSSSFIDPGQDFDSQIPRASSGPIKPIGARDPWAKRTRTRSAPKQLDIEPALDLPIVEHRLTRMESSEVLARVLESYIAEE